MHTINIAKADGKHYNGFPSYRFFYRIEVEEGSDRVRAILDHLQKVHPEPDWNISVSYTTTTDHDVTNQF